MFSPKKKVPILLAGLAVVASVHVAVAGKQKSERARRPDVVTERNSPYRGPVGAALKTTTIPEPRSGGDVMASASTNGAPSTLVLYDTSGDYGWLGELYAILTANLASHFGTWTAEPISRYTARQLESYTATVYIGSTYDEAIPAAFLDDVLATSKPVTWIGFNIWQLTNRWQVRNPATTFASQYGWMWSQLRVESVGTVIYKETALRRYRDNNAPIMNYSEYAPNAPVAFAYRDDGTSFPWAVRSRQLTYIGENPFVYMVEGDRSLAFEDMLFDALAPQTPERHRALVRLEDIAPNADPADLRAIADYLYSERVPFAFGVIPDYTDPNGYYNGGLRDTVRLRDPEASSVRDALRYMQQKGGVMVGHGWTHQYSNVANPYDAVSGDDFEFYRVVENADFTLTWVGPVAEDTSTNWTLNRLSKAAQEYAQAGFPTPSIFEFPHYSASANAYKAVASKFATRYDRTLYFRGLLSGGKIDHSRLVGQRFSYVVRDVYGTKVLPENLGNIETEPFHQYPVRFPSDIIEDSYKVKVVRDGFASFYFHPFFDINLLKATVSGLKQAGYTFVSPSTL
jgi:uncharacterized protein YdaL